MGCRIAILTLLISSSVLLAPESARAGHDGFFTRCRDYLFPSLRISAPVAHIIREVNIGDEVRVTTKRGAVTEGIVQINGFYDLTVNGRPIPQTDIAAVEILVHHIPTDADPSTQQRQQTHLERRRQFVDHEAHDILSETRESLVTEIQSLRAMPNGQVRQKHLRAVGQNIMAAISAQTGAANIGFHFNLNGGAARDYVDAGGIYAARGADVAVAYGARGSSNERIYFFDSRHIGLYDMLNETNPKLVLGGRMGNVLNVFSLDAADLSAATSAGAISKHASIFFDFNAAELARMPWNEGRTSRLIGIPISTYLAPALELFQDTSSLGLGRLSRDEETLVAMRYIERALSNQSR